METLKNKIIAIVGAAALLTMGIFFFVQAKDDRITNKVDALQKPVVLEEVYWYALDETNDTDAANQTFKSTTPMSAPLPNDHANCAQQGNAGDYCGVALKFTGTSIDTDLTGYSSVQDVLDNHPNAVEIAINDPSIDIDQDGYSQRPL
ncbi:hypothetical protein [Sphingobacterium faecale]|uniref:Uncharacterized protein n=1 Tax=Sphingobacterium faecale TaxID=2803775 RepID=A0ABS1R801_9SPHI|nr:hypothetical protein [Sphingobacterium faecale]MBL1410803.1 hypothetical protein [Sphingobacterium faecale]